jgi:membrane protease YdiL (CAAX protease family)
MRQRLQSLHPGLQTLLWVGVLFLPALPAYVWVWPNITGTEAEAWQTFAYVYVLVGTWWIGRRYTPEALGLNRKGWGVCLFWGGLLILGRSLVILSVDWGSSSPQLAWGRMLWEAFFYIALVGLTEELLFRGLLFQALLDWRGLRWAIWGTSVGFILWHIFGQGPLVGAAMLLYGLIFALMRWRAGGITGLIFIHGMMDWLAAQMMPDTNGVGLGRPEVPQPGWLLLGLLLIMVVPLGLWKWVKKTPAF